MERNERRATVYKGVRTGLYYGSMKIKICFHYFIFLKSVYQL